MNNWFGTPTTRELSPLEVLAHEVRGCTRCPILCQNRKQAVPGAGPMDAQVMVIAEKPGWHEDAQGVPMVGETGKVLNRILSRVGLDRGQIYLTNMIRCLPPKDHELTIPELDACRQYLNRELALIKPKVVIALGNFAIGAFFPRGTGKSADNRVGIIHGMPRCIFTDWGQMMVLPTYHPSGIYRDKRLEDVIITDLAIVRGLLEVDDDDEDTR